MDVKKPPRWAVASGVAVVSYLVVVDPFRRKKTRHLSDAGLLRERQRIYFFRIDLMPADTANLLGGRIMHQVTPCCINLKIYFYATLRLIAVTVPDAAGRSQNCAHDSIIARRFSSTSLRR